MMNINQNLAAQSTEVNHGPERDRENKKYVDSELYSYRKLSRCSPRPHYVPEQWEHLVM